MNMFNLEGDLMVKIGLVLVIDENKYLAKPIELPDYPVPGDS